jgi:hypothetical protein
VVPRRVAVGVLALATFAACARTSLTPVGESQYAPIAPEQAVAIYAIDGQVGSAFKVVALVTYVNPGKYQLLTLEDAMPELTAKARAAGPMGSSSTTPRQSGRASSARVSASAPARSGSATSLPQSPPPES